MRWYNLQKNKCPQCNRDFTKNLGTRPMKDGGKMMTHKCGFQISEQRYKEIVSDMVSNNIDEKNTRQVEGGDGRGSLL